MNKTNIEKGLEPANTIVKTYGISEWTKKDLETVENGYKLVKIEDYRSMGMVKETWVKIEQ